MSSPAGPRQPHTPRLANRLARASPSLDELGDDFVLQDAEWRGAALGGERVEFAELMSVRLAQADLAHSDWYRCSWVDVDADALDLANALFTESQWRRLTLRHSRLTGVQLAACTIEDAEVRDCVVDLANLRFATLRRVAFIGCQLRGVEFTSAQLSDVGFTDCDLAEVQFSQARCQRVHLANCRLDGLRGVDGLRGSTIAPLDLGALTLQFADALGIGISQA